MTAILIVISTSCFFFDVLIKPEADRLVFGYALDLTFSIMLVDIGYNVAIYDSYFAHEPKVLVRHEALLLVRKRLNILYACKGMGAAT